MVRECLSPVVSLLISNKHTQKTLLKNPRRKFTTKN